jgi:hypothetical protein
LAGFSGEPSSIYGGLSTAPNAMLTSTLFIKRADIRDYRLEMTTADVHISATDE